MDPLNPALIALCATLGARYDTEDVALSEVTAKVAEMKADAAALQLKLDQFPPPKEENEDEGEDVPALKARIVELEGMLAKKDEEEEEMKADAALKALVPIAASRKIKHDGLSLDELRLKVAQTADPSLTAETPAAEIAGVLRTVKLDKAPTSDPKRWDHSGNSGNSGERADAAKPVRADASDPDGPFYDPSLSRADAAYAGGV